MKKIYCLLVAFAFATFSLMAQIDFPSSPWDNQSPTSSPFASPSVGVSSLSGSSLGNTSMTFRSAYLDNNLVTAAPFEDINRADFMTITPPPPPGGNPDDQLPIGDVPFGFMAILTIGFVLYARRRRSC